MSKLFVMFCITDRTRLHPYQTVFRDNGVELSFIALGRGTAPSEILDLLGAGDSEKAMCISVISDVMWKQLRRDFIRNLKIDLPGVGIACIIPLSSVGGQKTLGLLTMNMDYQKEEESALKDTAHELIVAVCEQGYSETVMEAARKGGASGGTILHAKGTGQKKAEQFLGITLASEKDILLIVTETAKKNEIMRHIMTDAGLESRAKAITFSLPVIDVLGIRIPEEE